MNKQEIFDKVARHLLDQGTPSLQYDVNGVAFCAYRGNGGRACAVGRLILDEHYSPELEGRPSVHLAVVTALKRSGVDPASALDRVLLRRLQNVHDSMKVDDKRLEQNLLSDLREVAGDFGLDAAILGDEA